MTNWLAEEAYRAVLARRLQRRGTVVVFDRHFFCDYYAGAIAPTAEPRALTCGSTAMCSSTGIRDPTSS